VEPQERICVALDVPTLAEAEKIVDELINYVGMFKIGLQLFTAEGPRAVNTIAGLKGQVFLDLKFHDIPNTVAQAGREVAKLGITFFNVHASGGRAMMETVAQAVTEESEKLSVSKPKILAVTVLTSLGSKELKNELNIISTVEQQVIGFAKLAKESGLDGVVASAKDTERIRKACGDDFIILTPGIRPKWAAGKADQKRVTTPGDAVKNGSDFIVIGRPILEAKNRIDACRRIADEIAGQ